MTNKTFETIKQTIKTTSKQKKKKIFKKNATFNQRLVKH